MISVSLPVMLLAMSPVVLYFWYISKQYLRVSRDLKRLESVNKSPVYVLFSGKIRVAASSDVGLISLSNRRNWK